MSRGLGYVNGSGEGVGVGIGVIVGRDGVSLGITSAVGVGTRVSVGSGVAVVTGSGTAVQAVRTNNTSSGIVSQNRE